MGAIIHFGTDGWRSRLDADFTQENVERVADAAASYWRERCPVGTVYVGYDARPAARELAHAAARALAGHGLTAIMADRAVPTPAVSWAAAHDEQACGALMITGSRHPIDYLGIKLRMGDGGGGTAEFYDDLEDLMEPEPLGCYGEVHEADILTPYMEGLRETVDAAAIARAGLTVVCDPMYGAMRGSLAGLLRDMGVTVREIHAVEEEGWDELRPEPIEPWVDDCEREVVERGAALGLVTDADAGRIGVVDERGRFVNTYKVIALILGHLVRNRGMKGRVVLDLASSVLPRRVAEALGCRVTVKPIGFKHIYAEMLKGDVLLGGEEAGGIGVPAHLLERDGVLCCLLLCELLAMEQRALSELVDELDERFGQLSYGRRDLRCAPDEIEMLRMFLPGLNPPLVAGEEPDDVSHMDGLRFGFKDGSWLLIRPSGTESVIRVCAEAATIERRDELLDAGLELAKGHF